MTSETAFTDLEAVTMAANMNADTVRKQQREIRLLELRIERYRAALGSIYENALTCPGREAIQSLLNAGMLTQEDVT